MGVTGIVMLGVFGVLLAVQFKNDKQEYGIYVGVGVSLLIFFHVCEYLGRIMESFGKLKEMFEGSGAYLTILLKVTGVAYLSELGAGLCRDAGYQSIASQIELFGKVTVLLTGMPVILSLADAITDFMK